MATTSQLSGLEQELSALLDVDRFEPPDDFREAALWSDPAIYEEAAADPQAWWLRQATELLDWAEEPSESLDDSDPPFYKWFADGRLNASANCLDRHVEAGMGTGSHITGGARRARSATSPTPSCSPTCSASPTRSETAGSARATSSASTCR